MIVYGVPKGCQRSQILSVVVDVKPEHSTCIIHDQNQGDKTNAADKLSEAFEDDKIFLRHNFGF